MKIDKELLIKHHFWVLVGAFLLVLSIGFSTLLFGSSEGDKQKDFEKSQKLLSNYKAPGAAVNPATFIPPWETYRDWHSAHKDKVWKEAWSYQKDLITWPRYDQFDFQEQWNASTTFKNWMERVSEDKTHLNTALRAFKMGLYAKQFEELYQKVAVDKPVDFKGGRAGFDRMMVPPLGTTQVADGGNLPGRNFPQGQPGGQADANKTPRTLFEEVPTLEEAWLAQEDYWVKREIINAIAKTLHDLATMKEVPIDPKDVKKDGVIAHRRFRNNTWELDLLFEQNSGKTYVSSKGTIKNVDPARRTLALASPQGGILFDLKQPGVEPYQLEIKGEPRDPAPLPNSTRKSGCWTTSIPPSRSRWSRSTTGPTVRFVGSTRSASRSIRTARPSSRCCMGTSIFSPRVRPGSPLSERTCLACRVPRPWSHRLAPLVRAGCRWAVPLVRVGCRRVVPLARWADFRRRAGRGSGARRSSIQSPSGTGWSGPGICTLASSPGSCRSGSCWCWSRITFTTC